MQTEIERKFLVKFLPSGIKVLTIPRDTYNLIKIVQLEFERLRTTKQILVF